MLEYIKIVIPLKRGFPFKVENRQPAGGSEGELELEVLPSGNVIVKTGSSRNHQPIIISANFDEKQSIHVILTPWSP